VSATGVVVVSAVALVLVLLAVLALYDAHAHQRAIVDAVADDKGDGWFVRLRRAANLRARSTGWGRRLDSRLAGATVALGPADFIFAVAAAALLVGLASRGLVGWVGAVILMALVVLAAERWLSWQQQKRAERFLAQLPELARVLGNAASAGLAVRSGVDIVVREMDAPACEEFAEVSRRLALGTSLEDALNDLASRLPSPDISVLVKTIVVQNRAGGALVTALATIAETLDDRRELARELRTAVAGAVFSGYVVMAIAAGAVVLTNMMSPGALDRLVQTLPGQIVLVVSLGLFAVGQLLIRRITKVEV
jgi:tight adherence protein B